VKEMNQIPGIQAQFDAISDEDMEMMNRINSYSAEVLGDIDPQKTRISVQIEALRPIMQEIADEKKVPIEDIFIKYMDLASIIAAKKDAKLKEDLDAAGFSDFTKMR
jgi:hypothetical protein